MRRVITVLLLAVPVAAAVLGPLIADLFATQGGLPYGVDGPLGTDNLGRDVLAQLLKGGATSLGVAAGAVLLSYLVGGLIGLTAASARSRTVDDALIRPLDVLLPLPSLLVVSVVAIGGGASLVKVGLAVAVINLPTVARLVRAAALSAASGPVVEALRMQGESWWRIQLGFIGRSVLASVTADIGTRLTLAIFLVASANFLGLGLSPTSADWAVSIARNRDGLLLQPWAALAPAAMLVACTLGLNLLADGLLARARRLEVR
ncbi:ABC transporter permease [Pseudonocardiaceae bacterium YIM PH 21723]|nr:ABC transporter permease [Pseudonocardiaceae bacterium YIM PH 21723]